jgi:dTDP-4-amino-4,6-dideoxygalactose transaminase
VISVFGSEMSDQEIHAVSKCLESQWIGFGKVVEEFEMSVSQQLGLPDLVMVDSGSNALYLAIKLLGLPPGTEVILPSLTWISCANAVRLAGLTPVFADVELTSMNVTFETIQPLVTSNTSAIMVVHFAGLPVEIQRIKTLGLPIIEDCAHAVYSSLDGIPCGILGDIGVFSFDSVKNLAVGEGGGITSNDPAMMDLARKLRYCGIAKSGFDSINDSRAQEKMWWEYELEEPFIKMLPTNIAASIGLVQLRRREELQGRREKFWNRYSETLGQLTEVKIPSQGRLNSKHSFFTYVIQVEHRNQLAQYLLANGVYTTLRYFPLHNYTHFGKSKNQLPNTLTLSNNALSIPLHPRLQDSDIELIVNLISKFKSS